MKNIFFFIRIVTGYNFYLKKYTGIYLNYVFGVTPYCNLGNTKGYTWPWH